VAAGLRWVGGRGRPTLAAPLLSLIAVAVVAVVISGSRTSQVAAVVGLAGIWWSAGPRDVVRARVGILVATVATVVVLPFLYVQLDHLPGYEALDGAVERLTGKGIQTGRGERWLTVFDLVGDHPVIGHGYHYEEEFSTKTLHSHNLALATLFRGGWIGVAALIGFFGVLFSLARRTTTAVPTMLIAIVLVHQTFEANLFLGGIPVALPLAIVIGFAVAAPAPTATLADRSDAARTVVSR
jgi:O-antigen ligase